MFEREEPAPASLPELTADELKDLGLPLGARKKILKAIEAPRSAGTIAPPRSPASYTPAYLAEKILSPKAAREGERMQVTVLLAHLKGSMALLVDRDAEEARKILDPVLGRMMQAAAPGAAGPGSRPAPQRLRPQAAA